MAWAGLEGFALGGGLIIAIGAQNAFILRQGLLKQYVFPLCLAAALADALLIVAGVAGLGTIVKSNENLLFYVTLGGAAFLAAYALFAFARALRPQALEAATSGAKSLKAALAALAGFTFLNPHVYLDTVVLVGGISGSYDGAARFYFTIGACLASFVWFFSLGYGARLLQPLFAKSSAWRVLDFIIGAIMALLSWSLISRAFA
ncbi:LysE/ArgO family amino acid transporter [Pseudahrensia aquimaris]|uniref:LysE/ArgO family amino acid transporter n=1 Tax=Pseudahrensia aquimaris TaxID=744461 RepID=A0ABW3FFX2_9HYPH